VVAAGVHVIAGAAAGGAADPLGVLVPLGAVIPPLRKLVWERASSLSINPDFRRRPPEGDFARMVFWQELGASLWALRCLACAIPGLAPARHRARGGFVDAVLNQLRTLVAHLWENDGDPMTVTGAVSRFGQRAAAGLDRAAVGAGGPALSRAAPPAAELDALSLAGRGAPPPRGAPGRGIDL
jgi:hypothetical protein